MEKRKIFAISDMHSFYDETMKALADAKYDENDPDNLIVICGDILDRGPKSYAMFNWVKKMVEAKKAIYVRGNHESLFNNLVYRGYPQSIDLGDSNCTAESVCQLVSEDKISCIDTLPISFFDACQKCKAVDKWIAENSVAYYEIGRYIFVHAWIPVKNLDGKPAYYVRNRKFAFDPNWRNASPNEWIEASWGNPVNMFQAGFYERDKTIVCGHWHASSFHNVLELNKSDIWDFQPGANFGIFRSKDNCLVAIDACTAYTGIVNVLVISDVNATPNDPINLTLDSTKEVLASYERKNG